MAVNTHFYATLNELMGRAMGTVTNVCDYTTFVDAGKKLAEMSIDDLKNKFLTPLMNKVQKTINDNPSYMGALVDMNGGKLDYGVLETIMTKFYDMSESFFDGDTLTDGTTYTDQFKYNAPSVEVVYHMKSDSWERDISIRDTDIKGSLVDPYKMDSLIQTIFTGVANSAELAKEVARLGLLSDAIRLANMSDANETDENAVSRHYRLVSIYNHITGSTLTTQTALLNDDFVKWANLVINDIATLMTKPNDKFNGENFKTFTPKDYLRLKINGVWSKAVKRAVIGAFNPDNMIFDTKPEIIPYWQNSADRMRITTNLSGATTYSDHVVACLYDKRALTELIQLEDVENQRNPKRKFTTYFFQFNRMYALNKFANFAIFTLD